MERAMLGAGDGFGEVRRRGTRGVVTRGRILWAGDGTGVT